MTRINVGIPPSELNDKHLIAEAREIKRVPNCVAKGRYNLNSQPKEFTLGKGHVSFFYSRLGYLKKRYEELYTECKKRGFNVQYYGDAWNNIPSHLMGDYTPSDTDRQLIRERISERLKTSKKKIK
jgi:deoxyribonuclease (pyrimidine dimer)